MIIEDIKKANINSMKEHNSVARNIFSVVLGKIKLEEIKNRESGKEILEGDVLNILQKTLKELAEQKENYAKVNNTDKINEIEQQETVLNAFLPKMLTETEIQNIISEMPDKSIGAVMKKFKSEFNGKCDMRLVNEIAKRFA